MIECRDNIIRGIDGGRAGEIRPEFWKNEKGIWEIKDVYKGVAKDYKGWHTVASFETEAELKAWAEIFYVAHPWGTPEGGPKAKPAPYWKGNGTRTEYLYNLPRHSEIGKPGYSYHPEFRCKNTDMSGDCEVWDVVKDGKVVTAQCIASFSSLNLAKEWAKTHYGFGTSGGIKNKYVAPLPPLKEAEKKLLLLV